MMKNCFKGSLPEDICKATNLEILSLDGLTSAEERRFPRYMEGSIPPCVFAMDLRVLHISGNGLVGTIAAIPASSQLQNMSISHNQLTGTIPLTIQAHPFISLDLSANKLSGHFQPAGESQNYTQSIIINQNRLSGQLSSLFRNYREAKVLAGNLWKCTDSILPASDPNNKDYDCNAEAYLTSIIVWGCFTGVGFLMGLVYFWSGTRDRKPPDPNRHVANPTDVVGYLRLFYM